MTITDSLYLAMEDDERIIDRLTEDEGDADFLNDLDQWDPALDFDGSF